MLHICKGNQLANRGMCKPCRRVVLLEQYEIMHRSEISEQAGNVDDEIQVLLGEISRMRKKGFVEKKEVLLYGDSERESSECSDRSDSSSESGESEKVKSGEEEYVPNEDVIYSSDDGWQVAKKRGSLVVKKKRSVVSRERAEVNGRKVAKVGKKICRRGVVYMFEFQLNL